MLINWPSSLNFCFRWLTTQFFVYFKTARKVIDPLLIFVFKKKNKKKNLPTQTFSLNLPTGSPSSRRGRSVVRKVLGPSGMEKWSRWYNWQLYSRPTEFSLYRYERQRNSFSTWQARWHADSLLACKQNQNQIQSDCPLHLKYLNGKKCLPKVPYRRKSRRLRAERPGPLRHRFEAPNTDAVLDILRCL